MALLGSNCSPGLDYVEISKYKRMFLWSWSLLFLSFLGSWLGILLSTLEFGLDQVTKLIPFSRTWIGDTRFSPGSPGSGQSFLVDENAALKIMAVATPLLIFSAALPPICWLSVRSTLRLIFESRMSRYMRGTSMSVCSENSTSMRGERDGSSARFPSVSNEMLSDAGEGLTANEDGRMPRLCSLDILFLILIILLSLLVNLINGLTGGHTAYVLRAFFGIPASDSLSCMGVSCLTVYLIGDALLSGPAYWRVSGYIRIADRSFSAGECEICSEGIQEGQVTVNLPVEESLNIDDSFSASSSHCHHLTCFLRKGGSINPGCHPKVRWFSFPDSFLMWFFLGLVVVVRVVRPLKKAPSLCQHIPRKSERLLATC